MRPFRTTILAMALVALATPLAAWGPTGHRVVGRIAQNHLSPAAAAEVEALLGPRSLAQASTWADEIRSDPAWDHAAPWHYVSIGDDETYATSEKNPDGDILVALERFSATLADPEAPEKERRHALQWLVHLVGDLHQPLHVGRADDRGGNDILVLYFDEPANLHQVWDSRMIDSERLSFTEMARFLDHTTPEEVAATQQGTFLDWARESKALREEVYRLGDQRLSWSYLRDSMPIVRRRLLQAGLRLAGLLDELLAPEPTPATP